MCRTTVITILLAACIFAGCSSGIGLMEPPVAEVNGATPVTDATPTPSPSPTPTPSPTSTPSPAPTPNPTPSPSPTPEPTPTPTPFVQMPLTSSGLPNDTLSWYYNKIKDHQPPTAQRSFDIGQYDAYYLGDVSGKNFYLTFDEGYENGYTAAILDTLLEKDVKAAFFLTKSYIASQPELVLRMVYEGHLACNHSATHPSMPLKSDDEIEYELTSVDDMFFELTGQHMPRFFRPPMGEYSQRTLDLTAQLGYKTIFWSFAYEDWLVDKQPAPEETLRRVMDNLHNGEIILLHAVSSANTEALPDIIDAIRAEGYEFKTLHELN